VGLLLGFRRSLLYVGERLLMSWRALAGTLALTLAAEGAAAQAVVTAAQRTVGCVALFESAARQWSAPCGAPAEVEPGTFAWLETASEITPFRVELAKSSVVKLDGLRAAGAVKLPAAFRLAAGETVTAYSLVPPPRGRRLFQRRIAGTGVTMPAGRAFGVLFDARGRAAAISPPVTVPPRGTVELSLARPAAGVDVLALIDRPLDPIDANAQLAVRDAKKKHAPDVMVSDGTSFVAAWYGLDGGELELAVDSDTFWLNTAPIVARPREAVVIRDALRLLPALTVKIGDLPHDVVVPPMSLVVRRQEEKTAIRSMTVKPGGTYAIERLPAANLDVVLTIGDFITGRRVALTSGDANAEFPLQPIQIRGTVFHGNDRAPAEIRILQADRPLIVKTDERGEYTLTLWTPQRRVFVDTVLMADASTPPFRSVATFDASRTFDIRVPASRLAARVFDAVDGTPIVGATVELESTFTNAETGRASHDMRTFQTTSERLTQLPSLRPGSATLRARAAGYDEPPAVSVPVSESGEERIVDIAMKRQEEGITVHLSLPDGSPAAGAEVAATTGAMELLWQGVVGADGVVHVPKRLEDSLLMVRHRAGASSIFLFRGSMESLPPLGLEAPAPPLTVTFVDATGSPIGPAGAPLAVWVSGYRLTGAALAFYSWSSAVTAIDGKWTAKNLPRHSLRVVAVRGAAAALQRGTYDALATAIGYPWAPASTVRVAE
jgi:hypothetical protein